MNVVVPLAGRDKNFENLGDHKALTRVFGKPIIRWIAESRPYDLKKATFVLLEEHNRTYHIASRLEETLGADLDIVWARTMTAGAPQSVLLCSERINTDESLVVDLADQYIDFKNLSAFIDITDADGVIPTFESLYWNRGYMEIDDSTGLVRRVSEKDSVPISTHSTACVSYFRRGHEFVSAARKMIEQAHVAANGAFLVSLAYNEMIEAGKAVVTYPCEFIATLGSIEGVACFEQLVRPVNSGAPARGPSEAPGRTVE